MSTISPKPTRKREGIFRNCWIVPPIPGGWVQTCPQCHDDQPIYVNRLRGRDIWGRSRSLTWQGKVEIYSPTPEIIGGCFNVRVMTRSTPGDTDMTYLYLDPVDEHYYDRGGLRRGEHVLALTHDPSIPYLWRYEYWRVDRYHPDIVDNDHAWLIITDKTAYYDAILRDPLDTSEYGQLWRNAWYGILRIVDSTTGEVFYRHVPSDITTAREAVAWTFGLSTEQYAPQIET